jgi:diguanylate cyclase (GGDEF)-like protein
MFRDLPKPRILIVDDEACDVAILGEALRPDHEVFFAVNGDEALRIATSDKPPDLVLLDVMMPRLDGYEVCRRLKENDQTHNIPVIFITVKDGEEDEAKGLELGAIDYVTKPFSLPIVKARVKNHVELKRRGDDLENLSSLDGLTSIPNRRRFDELLGLEWRRAMRTPTWLSLVMMDIDLFKAYNDYYGHPAGDKCLKQVARKLAYCLTRAGDFVARYGGEEFVAILPEVDSVGAAVVAERLRSEIQSLNIEHRGSPTSQLVTMSFGTASVVPKQGSSQETLIAAADKMLYEAKMGGRNSVRSCILGQDHHDAH